METSEFRTKTILNFKKDGEKADTDTMYPIGLDIGYSSVKVYSKSAVVCFPAYAEINENDVNVMLSGGNEQAIYYIGSDGVKWTVGACAQDSIATNDTTAGSLAIYGRMRYFNPMFKVLALTGIAAGMRDVSGWHTRKPVAIQTGLPPAYFKSDESLIVESLTGHHEFSVKFGTGKWEKFSIDIDKNNLLIMDQPMGTFYSVSIDRLGHLNRTYMASKVLIADPGFGTFDVFSVDGGQGKRRNAQSLDLGMKQVLIDTCDEIFDKYKTEISIPAFQRYLLTGSVPVRSGRGYIDQPFKDILEKHSKDVCRKALDNIQDTYNPALEFDYLVITGGTGAAWLDYVREYFGESGRLKIIGGNAGDPELPFMFSNVRGYFYYIMFQTHVNKIKTPVLANEKQ